MSSAFRDVLIGLGITLSGVLAFAQGDCSVTSYGGSGNCTGSGATSSCFDNHTAIQAAINACYLTGGSVYFPANTSGTSGQSVYYTSTPINPEGVSMYGPPGASGASNFFPNNLPVAVRGAPGNDVFDVVAQGSSGYVAPRPSFTVKDLAIIVDDSTDVSSSNTTRRPGRICTDAAITASSAVLTSSAQCEFQPGDAGQAITVAGAGNGGSTLTTTVASWQSATQVTLTASASTTVGSATTYISVANLSAIQNIGNCAFAYDDPGATFTGLQPDKTSFSDVVIQVLTGAHNHTCGYFFQGQQAPYQTKWEHGFVAGDFGFVFAPVSTATPTTSIWAGMGDFNQFNQIWIGGQYSFISYGGGFTHMQDVQISSSAFGPEILASYGVYAYPHTWFIDIPEIEPGTTCPTGNIAFRISGYQHTVNRLSTVSCSNSGVLQWDATEVNVANFSNDYLGTINITGGNNWFYEPHDITGGTTVFNVTGAGNTYTTGNSGNPFDGIQPARRQYAGTNDSAVGIPQVSRGAIAFNRTHDFLDKGAVAYYLNSEDLWLWPSEVGTVGGTAPAVVTDGTSESGQAFTLPATTRTALSESNGTSWMIGSQFPAGEVRLYFKMKAASGTPTLNVYAINGTTFGVISSSTFTLSTSYAIYSFDAKLSGLSGVPLLIEFGDSGTDPTSAVSVAWIGVRPWTNDEVISGAGIYGGAQSISGCSLSNAKGGASRGSFNSGTSGTCTATITPGLTAPNGWTCWASDLTTSADVVRQTTTSTTACTISGTTVSGDLITWGADAF